MKYLSLLLAACCGLLGANAQSTHTASPDPAPFIPGAIVLFEDDFRDAQMDLVPAGWRQHNLNSGPPEKGGVTILNGQKALAVLSQDHRTAVGFQPVLPAGASLGTDFTIEYDYFEDESTCRSTDGNCAAGVTFFSSSRLDSCFPALHCPDQQALLVWLNGRGTWFCSREDTATGNQAIGNLVTKWYPGTFDKKAWHHVAVAYREGQVSLYVDHHLILTATACHVPTTIQFDGSGVYGIRNVRIAANPAAGAFRQLERGERLVTQAIRFDVDQSVIKPESLPYLRQLAQWLQQHPAIRLQINGHTDGEGTPAHNLQLSRDRAAAIKQQLVAAGIPEARLVTKGFGATRPVDNAPSPAARAKNRRVELVKL